MMKQFLPVAFMTCLILSAARAQEIKVTIGPTLDQKEILRQMELSKWKLATKASSVSSMFFFDNRQSKAYSGIGFASGKIKLMSFDNYLVPAGVKELTAEFVKENEQEEVRIHTFLNRKDKLYILYSINYSKLDKFSLYVNEVSTDLVLLGSPILLHSFSDVKNSGMGLEIVVSKDESHLLAYRLYDTRSREQQQFECIVFDASFGLVWKNRFDLGLQDKELAIQSSDVDKNGNFFMLANRMERAKSIPVVYSYAWREKKFSTMSIGLPEGENFGASLELVDGVSPVVVGLNRVKKKITYFVNKLDGASGQSSLLGKGDMPDDFYRLSNLGAYESDDWEVKNLVSLDNGDFVATIESSLVLIKNGIEIGYFSYHAYVISFTREGKPKWTHVVRKKQNSLRENIGHLLIPYQNKVLIIYNDTPVNLKKNIDEKIVEPYTGLKEAVTLVQEIDDNGKVKRYPFSTSADLKNYNLNLQQLNKISENRYQLSAFFLKSRLSMTARNLTFEIKE